MILLHHFTILIGYIQTSILHKEDIKTLNDLQS